MTSLATRHGLPDALRILLADYPRTGWQTHPHFDGLVRFWLDRHLAFRELLAAMTADTQALLDTGIEAETFARRLSRLGGTFVDGLHGHHGIEDGHYFPLLAKMEPRLARGFDLLEEDHHALAAHLDRFTDAANAVLRGWQTPALHDRAAAFLDVLGGSAALLGRHLTDEEDLIVPVILAGDPGRLG